MKKIDIGYEPTEIQEGMMVKLIASTAPPAKISECKWRVQGPGVLQEEDALTIPDTLKPAVILWDTTGLQSGPYTIYVEAKLASPGAKGSVATTDGAGDVEVTVLPRSVSSLDVERLAKGAKEFAQHLK